MLAVDEPDDTHVLERDDPADGGGDPVEDLLELQGLRGDLGDLGEDAGYGLGINGLDDTHAAAPVDSPAAAARTRGTPENLGA